MKKVSAPGRRASTKRTAFKADDDGLIDEINAAPAAAKVEAADTAVRDADAAAESKLAEEAALQRRLEEEARQQREQELEADRKRQQAQEREQQRQREQAEQQAAMERLRLEEEEEDRLFKEEEARRAAEDEAELEQLKLQIAEKERARQEALAAAETERLRVLAELEQEEQEARRRDEVAAAARALAAAAERDAQAAREREEAEAAESARLQALEAEAAAKAAKDSEWRRLMEEEEALLQREKEEQAARQEAERVERERAEAARLEAEAAEAARLEQERQRAEEEAARLERERAQAAAAAQREAARVEAEAAEAARLERELAERARLEAEAAEAARLEQERQRAEEEAALAAAAEAEEEHRRRQAELEERRLAVVAREEAEAAEQRRRIEEARRKRQSFLSDTDAFSANLETQYQAKDEKLNAVKSREGDLFGDEIKSSSEQFKAQVPSKRVEEEPVAPALPAPRPVEQPEPEPEQARQPAVEPAAAKPSAEANATFAKLTSSLFAEDEEEKKDYEADAPDPSTAGGSVGLFGEDTGAQLFGNRTFAVKKEKKAAAKAAAAPPAAAAGAARAGEEEDEEEVDWDRIESEGKQNSLSGDMAQQWKARQIDLTTRRLEFRGAVCYGLGGIFAWQMYSAAESRDEVGKPYTEYLMRCQWGTKWDNMQPWLVARRYREFDFLDTNIRKEFPALKDKLIPLPGKAILSFGQASVPERTRGIEDYMINILNTVPQVLKSSHMYIFLDLTERIEGIRKKIKENERNGGAAEAPQSLPVPGAKKELGRAAPAPAAGGGGGRAAERPEPTFAPTKSSGVAGFGPDGLNSSLVPARAAKAAPAEEPAAEEGHVDPLDISELLDEARAEAARQREGNRALDDDALGVLEEQIRDLIAVAKRTRPAEVQRNARLIRALRQCQSKWPSLRATCTIDADPLSNTSMLVPRALQAEEDLDRVVKEIKSVLIAQSIGSPLHF